MDKYMIVYHFVYFAEQLIKQFENVLAKNKLQY